MKKQTKYIHLIFWILILFKTESSSSQSINENLDSLFYNETFDNDNSIINWRNEINSSNSSLKIQNGVCNLDKPGILIINLENLPSNFRLISSIKIEGRKSDNKIGIVLADTLNEKVLSLLLNGLNEYSIVKFDGNELVSISGTKNMWNTSSLLKKNQFNELEIRKIDANFDFYINNKFILNFKEEDIKKSGVGFIVGPHSVGKTDFFKVYINPESENQNVFDQFQTENNLRTESYNWNIDSNSNKLKHFDLEIRAIPISNIINMNLFGEKSSKVDGTLRLDITLNGRIYEYQYDFLGVSSKNSLKEFDCKVDNQKYFHLDYDQRVKPENYNTSYGDLNEAVEAFLSNPNNEIAWAVWVMQENKK